MANEQTKQQGTNTPPPNTPALNQVQDGDTPAPEVDTTQAGTGVTPEAPLLQQANSGGLIDNGAISPTTPVYAHAGSMGGTNVWDCDLCGAIVRDAYQNQHNAFHAQVAGVMRYTGIR